jgi:hypothetical protein
VPTPFYHLSIAEELLEHPGLPGSVRLALSEQRGAFLLGNTAPDVQVVSGQNREDTHFFTLPVPPNARPPWEQMLIDHPGLAGPENFSPVRAAFLAGYLIHLQADWLWVRDIFIPIFGPDNTWESFRYRLYLHNVLRAYLDRQIITDLPAGTGQLLHQVEPQEWLPFVRDHHLRAWQGHLAQQLEPGAEIQTVEVFASRQGISPARYYQLLESESQMDEAVFSRIPRRCLLEYRLRLVEENVELLQSYLSRILNYENHRAISAARRRRVHQPD